MMNHFWELVDEPFHFICFDRDGLVNEVLSADLSLALEISLTYLKFQVRYIEDSF